MKSFWRLLRYLSRYQSLVVAAIGCNILTAVFTVISIPMLIPFFQILFDRTEMAEAPPSEPMGLTNIPEYINYEFTELITTQGQETALAYVCVAIVIVYFLRNIFRYLALYFMAPVRNGVIRDLRDEMFEQVLTLPLSYFGEERKGDLLSRLTSDVQEVESSILNMLEVVFREPLIITGALAFMIYVSPGLTVFVFLLIIFTGVVIGGLGKRLKRTSTQVQDRLGHLLSLVEEGLGGLRIIKGFAAEDYQRNKFSTANNDYRNLLTKLLRRRDLASPLSEFLGIATVAALLWYGSRQVFSGVLDAETFITFIFAFYNVIDPAKNIAKATSNIQRGIGAFERIEQLLDAVNNLPEAPDAKTISTFGQGISYRQVGFRYRDVEGPVLQNIDLEIPKGKVVALVGASGAGKSTLVDLLPRFYDVTEGGIFIDGVDVRQLRRRDLRRLLGIVSQEAILFNDTIYNNIVFGLDGVTQQAVEEAARIANAHDFIIATENGYGTNIGDRGNKLSGGQRQRLTIARAILRNPPILILDEATSALDSESERLVQDALTKLMEGRTAIVIAHRLSTIQHADEIIVMREGRIVERGTHLGLLEQGGEYRKLVALQGLE
ncbi:ABC transporter ATP-binding protein [Lewinella cohaerens]|uniref:ABC transporter ATP-binding protein n=1 Tax=Lewinella cohaerens TaxID=70995 RepID=UPI000380B238|nr:ABC transporter ATP-binding protein [Lewinella cohaerens]